MWGGAGRHRPTRKKELLTEGRPLCQAQAHHPLTASQEAQTSRGAATASGGEVFPMGPLNAALQTPLQAAWDTHVHHLPCGLLHRDDQRASLRGQQLARDPQNSLCHHEEASSPRQPCLFIQTGPGQGRFNSGKGGWSGGRILLAGPCRPQRRPCRLLDEMKLLPALP